MKFETIELAIMIFLCIACVLDMFWVLKRSLMMLQLNSYRNERYIKWFNESKESTSLWRIGACIALFLLLIPNFPLFFNQLVAAVILLCNFISYARKKYKKPLVFTRRAIRLYTVMILLGLGISIAVGFITCSLLIAVDCGITVIILSPLVTLFANILLKPIESNINKKYYNNAVSILKSCRDLTVVGITGSYGKTSTKHYLQRILSERYETLMTPGSYNTTLGVVRTIRELLKPYTRIFIVEMGAKQKGDIKEICELVKPQIGIITSIGEQHLETFGSVENVLKTKFELVDALPPDGLAVVNQVSPGVASRDIAGVEAVRFSVDGKIDKEVAYYADDIKYDKVGASFTVKGPDGFELKLTTPLLGKGNISNLVSAIVVALKLGVTNKEIERAVKQMTQVEHRLSTKNTAAGFTIIDDAFNSNPQGSSMALDVISQMKTSGKKYIITPGMIELGSRQFEANKEFGMKIAKSVDKAIIVGEYNREAILEGIGTDVPDDFVILSPDFTTAQQTLMSMISQGDIVLYENDLPDTFK